jgi:hypothetical protein
MRLLDHPRVAIGRLFRRQWLPLALCVGVVPAVLAGYSLGERRFSDERAEMSTKIENYRRSLTDASQKSKGRDALEAKVQQLADQMLGPTLETVDSEVRRRLNRACEELGITDFSVTTGASVVRQTPAKKEFRQPEVRKYRDAVDFVEVEATIIASGTVESIYRLIFRVDAEPWMKRIGSIRLNPTSDGQFARLNLRLSTPFMPGMSAKAPLKLDPARLEQASRYASLFSSNPFRIPPPPVIAPPPTAVAQGGAPQSTPSGEGAPPVAVVAAPPGAFPYGEWQITGVVEGPSGAEAWLRHLPSGATLALQPGNAVGELVFRRVEYDFAVFDSPSGACRIQVGTNLTQRGAVAG